MAQRHQYVRIVNGLALASILFASVGAHLVHPMFHDDLDDPPPVAEVGFGNLRIAATGSEGGPSAEQTDEDECPICRFLKVFRSPTPATAMPLAIADTSTIGLAKPGHQVIPQDFLKAASPRGPPALSLYGPLSRTH